MKSVSGKIVSSKPISLSKASKILSKFVSFENGASQPVSVYLRRTSAAFAELTRFHKELKPSRSHRKYRFKNYNSIVQIPEEDGVEHFEDGIKINKISKKENPVRKEGEIDGERDGKRDKKKKSESVETESGSSLGVELVKRKEKKKRKGGEIDDEVAFDSGEQKKKKKRRRIEGSKKACQCTRQMYQDPVPLPPPRRNSYAGMRSTIAQINEVPDHKKHKKTSRRSFMGFIKKNRGSEDNQFDNGLLGGDDEESDDENDRPHSLDDKVRKKEMRKGIDLATTLERIEKNFVITDPRLLDNPIIFASDRFLELTEYSHEEILGRNCRFLQGPETDPATVRKIRDAIDNRKDVTVQLINYTKTGKKFWNLFHLQPMRDQKGEVQYFIGVQLDGSQHVEPLHNCIPETTVKESSKLVKETAENVDEAVRELPDANSKPEDLWNNHLKVVHPKPHRRDSSSWRAIQKILNSGEQLSLKHFKPVKPLGSGDTGSVHLVELCDSGEYFAMKAMDKGVMLNRNKVHRACAEREILDILDHPFLPALYASFQTKTHICLITDYCPGGEFFVLLDRQPMKVLKEDAVRFFVAEVVVALEYLHCQGDLLDS